MPQQDFQRVDLATEQLDVAIELFLSKRSFVSALTLAGAAEEIFGKGLSHSNKENWLMYEHGIVEEVESIIRDKPYLWKDFKREKNRIRNAAKHFDSQSESSVNADIEEDAFDLILRALENHRRLKLPCTKQIENFSTWFHENVVGIEYEEYP